MLKMTTNFVLASLGDSTYAKKYASSPRLRPRLRIGASWRAGAGAGENAGHFEHPAKYFCAATIQWSPNI